MNEKKRLAAEKAVELVQDGMKVGLGTGSTAFFAIEAIGRLVKNGYKILAVPTSVASWTPTWTSSKAWAALCSGRR
jgi:ribose 5-phosphate isomerase A